MFESERFYPKEVNLGSDCLYWCLGGLASGCSFPKAELEGRRSCEGIIDDVCLFVKNGREPRSLSDEQMIEIKTRAPDPANQYKLPPGNIE